MTSTRRRSAPESPAATHGGTWIGCSDNATSLLGRDCTPFAASGIGGYRGAINLQLAWRRNNICCLTPTSGPRARSCSTACSGSLQSTSASSSTISAPTPSRQLWATSTTPTPCWSAINISPDIHQPMCTVFCPRIHRGSLGGWQQGRQTITDDWRRRKARVGQIKPWASTV